MSVWPSVCVALQFQHDQVSKSINAMNAKVFKWKKKNIGFFKGPILNHSQVSSVITSPCLGVWKVAHLALCSQPTAETNFPKISHMFGRKQKQRLPVSPRYRVPSVTSQRADFSLQ